MQRTAESKSYDLHFLVKDEKSGSPMANIPYKLTLETGLNIVGVTNQQGLTHTIAADSALIAKLEVPYYGDSSSNAHAHDEYGPCDC
jgi:type VI secretion system secreted protein VgrG